MRWLLTCLVLIVGAEASASIILTRDGRLIESICDIAASGDTILGDTRPPEPPDDWTETFTLCGEGFGHMDSTIEDDFLGATMWASGHESPDFDERTSVLFRIEFEVTSASLAEWIDASGSRVETLVPGTTYIIESVLDGTGPRVDATASVRLIPEPAGIALMGFGVAALGARSLFPERRLPLPTYVDRSPSNFG